MGTCLVVVRRYLYACVVRVPVTSLQYLLELLAIADVGVGPPVLTPVACVPVVALITPIGAHPSICFANPVDD